MTFCVLYNKKYYLALVHITTVFWLKILCYEMIKAFVINKKLIY